MKKIINYLKQPKKIIIYLMNKNFFFWMNDKTFLKLKYRLIIKKKLDLNKPKTFNEKLQWLKLYDRNPEYTKMVDKYEAKKYVASIIGDEYIIKTLGIYNNFEEIDFNKLPNQFVVKPTHTSGDIFICKDKKQINYKELRNKVLKWLRRKYYYFHREWPYKNIKPRIIAEEYMEDKNRKELTDYKIYCFNGKCEYVMTCIDRKKGKTKFIYFDRKWNMKKEFSSDGLKYGNEIKIDCPKNLEEMFQIAEKLSEGIPFVRVDLYEVDGKVYFGEMTFFPSAGFDNTRTTECEEYLNKSLKLGEKYE